MKTVGIQIKSNEAILVILEKDSNGSIGQTSESTKFNIGDSDSPGQVKQFRDQINTAFDAIKPTRIGIMARNAKAKGVMMPSPLSFKLEGIIQLYNGLDIEIIWPQTLNAYYKKQPKHMAPKNKYQEDAFDVAYYLINKN